MEKKVNLKALGIENEDEGDSPVILPKDKVAESRNIVMSILEELGVLNVVRTLIPQASQLIGAKPEELKTEKEAKAEKEGNADLNSKDAPSKEAKLASDEASKDKSASHIDSFRDAFKAAFDRETTKEQGSPDSHYTEEAKKVSSPDQSGGTNEQVAQSFAIDTGSIGSESAFSSTLTASSEFSDGLARTELPDNLVRTLDLNIPPESIGTQSTIPERGTLAENSPAPQEFLANDRGVAVLDSSGQVIATGSGGILMSPDYNEGKPSAEASLEYAKSFETQVANFLVEKGHSPEGASSTAQDLVNALTEGKPENLESIIADKIAENPQGGLIFDQQTAIFTDTMASDVLADKLEALSSITDSPEIHAVGLQDLDTIAKGDMSSEIQEIQANVPGLSESSDLGAVAITFKDGEAHGLTSADRDILNSTEFAEFKEFFADKLKDSVSPEMAKEASDHLAFSVIKLWDQDPTIQVSENAVTLSHSDGQGNQYSQGIGVAIENSTSLGQKTSMSLSDFLGSSYTSDKEKSGKEETEKESAKEAEMEASI